jgi:chromosomal replication initiation ATPase DnaA
MDLLKKPKISPYVYPGIAMQPDNYLVRILSVVCDVVYVDIQRVCDKKRYGGNITIARHLYCYLAKKNTEYTFREIGEIINRNHATVISSVKHIEDMIYTNDKKYFQYLKELNIIQ